MTTIDLGTEAAAAAASPTLSGVCVIGQITVKDDAKWATYCSLVPGTLAAWGASLATRGTHAIAFNGEARGTDLVVVRFPDIASAEGWYASPSYQALVPLRDEAADVTIVAYKIS